MKTTHFITLISILTFSSNSAPIDGPLILTEAVEIAKQNNLTLKQQVERVNIALRELNVQKAGLFPQISANGTYYYTSEIPQIQIPQTPITIEAGVRNQYDLNLKFQQPLFTGFRTLNRINAAIEDLNSAVSGSRGFQNEILFQVYNIFYTAQLNQVQRWVLQASLNRAEKNLTTTKYFYLAGQVSAFDTLRVANQNLNIKTEINKLTHQYEVILSQLAFILNIPENRDVEHYSEATIDFQLESLETYIDMALNHRPEVTAIHHQIKSNNYHKKTIRSSFYPQLYGQVALHYGKPGVDFFKNEWTDYLTVGINLQWELWNLGKRRQQLKQANYNLNILTHEQKKIIESIKKEVKQGYQNLLSDRDQIELTEQLVRQERERYRIINNQYNQGLASSLDLTEAENALTTAELRLQQNKINWYIDRAYLKLVTGQIDIE
jgi:outer membrane protein